MSNLPEKWAVRIGSLQDAEELQKMFPDVDDIGGGDGYWARLELLRNTVKNYTTYLIYSFDEGTILWGTNDSYKRNGYTILTLEQLKELKND